MRFISDNVFKTFSFFTKSGHVRDHDEATRRRWTLSVLLLGAVFLSLIATLIALAERFFGSAVSNGSVNYIIPLLVLLFFLIVYFLLRRGKTDLVGLILVGFFTFFATYMSYHWSIGVTEAMLIFAFVIVVSPILINMRFAMFMTLSIVSTIGTLFYLDKAHYAIPDLTWRSRPPVMGDAITYSATLLIIGTVSWIYSHEIERSLRLARNSEAELKKERDLLEIKVEERSRDLKQAQAERIEQLNRFTEFGRLSSGVFHDLTNYLNTLMLYLEKASSFENKDVVKVKEYLEEFEEIRSDLGNFIEISRRQLKNSESPVLFSLTKEIESVIRIFSYITRKAGITVSFLKKDDFEIIGDSAKFNHVITSLLENAVDACLDIADDKKIKIEIDISSDDRNILISVQDNGCGIAEENIKKIFDDFYTTKNYQNGTGLGLAIAKNIITKSFNGTISVRSVFGEGTTFLISIPIKQI